MKLVWQQPDPLVPFHFARADGTNGHGYGVDVYQIDAPPALRQRGLYRTVSPDSNIIAQDVSVQQAKLAAEDDADHWPARELGYG